MSTETPDTGVSAGVRIAIRPYIPAVSPRLKILLALIFATFAVLGATGAYLTSVRLLEYFTGQTYTKPFKYWMLIGHIGVGVLMTAPFIMFGVLHWLTARTRSNRYAIKLGIILFFTGLLVCASGYALVRLEGMPQLRTDS